MKIPYKVGIVAGLLGLAALPVGNATGSAATVVASTPARAVNGPVHVLRPPSQAGSQARTAARVGAVLPYNTSFANPPLLYRGGAISKAMTSYVIFWNPGHLQDGTVATYSAKYKTLVPQFFRDFSKTKLAANLTQYYGVSGSTPNTHIGVIHPFGSAFADTSPFPVGDCTTSQTGGNCVSQGTLAKEAIKIAALHQITAGTGKMFLIYTPKGEGSCFGSGACADSGASYTGYCAYHSFVASSAVYGPYKNLVWANQPYPTSPGGANCYAPGAGQTFPNGDTDSDASINVTSHELNEAITDPLPGSGWTDASGYEIGDECAWEFGPTLPSGGDVLWKHGTHPYSIQPEASNASVGCVLAGP